MKSHLLLLLITAAISAHAVLEKYQVTNPMVHLEKMYDKLENVYNGSGHCRLYELN